MSDREQVFGVGDHRRQTFVLCVMLLQVSVTDDALLRAGSSTSRARRPTTTHSAAATRRRLHLPSTTDVEQRRRETHRQVARVHLRIHRINQLVT